MVMHRQEPRQEVLARLLQDGVIGLAEISVCLFMLLVVPCHDFLILHPELSVVVSSDHTLFHGCQPVITCPQLYPKLHAEMHLVQPCP